MIRFEWDPDKARTNLAKHGVAFEDAQLVWDDPHHILRQDRHEDGEERWQVMGYAYGVVILVVWHTYPDPNDEEKVRIIGARKAELRERSAYEQGT
jgi:uncharacterized DUF497 family protein